jgi:DNA-binding MarR family transcriptional regulator
VRDDARERLAGVPLARLLGVASHVTRERWARVSSGQHGLSPAGASVLFVLAERGDTPGGAAGQAHHRELARHCWVRPATLTGIIDTLERDGYVERLRDDNDRRQVRISLTAAGRGRVRDLGAALRVFFPPTVVERDPAKAAAVREYLTELIETYHERDADIPVRSSTSATSTSATSRRPPRPAR